MKIDGIEQLRRKFRQLPHVAREEIERALVTSGEEFAATARALAPVDEGDLRDSIVVTRPGQHTPLYSLGGRREAGDAQVIVSAGNYAVRYVAHVEYGTADMAARPFFWPAWRSVRRRVRGRVSRAHRSAAKKVAGT